MGQMRNGYNILFKKCKGNRPLRRPKHKWEGNITMDLREIVLVGGDWMHLAQDRDQKWALGTQ
jgi:hypothetical protein